MALLKSKREKMLLGLAALAVLVGGGYFLVYQPLREKYLDMDTQIANARKRWEESKQRFIQSEQYRADYDFISSSLSIEGDEQAKKDRINQELTKLLEETGIRYSQRSEKNAEQVHEEFRVYSFSLTGIQTDWPTLATFLYRIETSPAILEIKKLSVRGMGGRTRESDAIQVDLDISRLVEHKVQRRTDRTRRTRTR